MAKRELTFNGSFTSLTGLIVGGFSERVSDGLFNAAILVGPEGLVIHYRKLHLFGNERNVFEPGDLGLPVAETFFGTIGICVCYDLRFVEVIRVMALRGAEFVAVPTAWVAGFDKSNWDEQGFCPQARGAAVQANLNQVFIGCASQVGQQSAFNFLGSSVLIDPYGKTISGPLSGHNEQVTSALIDVRSSLKAQTRSRLVSPRLERRTDVYGVNYEGTSL